MTRQERQQLTNDAYGHLLTAKNSLQQVGYFTTADKIESLLRSAHGSFMNAHRGFGRPLDEEV